MSKPRAALYLRQSTYKEESISLELQERACRTYAEQQGYDVVAIESDPGISGRTWNRPGVHKVLELLETKSADVIVLWKWSRLSRSRLDWAVAADRVETMGGRIESATEQIDVSTSTGRLARGMLTEFAAFESERIGDTWKETHARRVRNGLPHHGLPRFGYDYDRIAGYTVNEASGPVLREMYLRFIRGVSLREIGAYAASEGFTPRSGWRDDGVRQILDRGFGAGLIRSKGEFLPGAHEPVISEKEWAAYQVKRSERAARGMGGGANTGGGYAYSALLRCFCGAKMDGGATKRNGKVYRRYTCRDGLVKGSHARISVSESYVEEAVLAWMQGVAAEIDALATQVKPKSENLGRKSLQLASDLKKNQDRLDKLTIRHLDDEIPKDVYERLKAKFEDEKKALEARQRLVEVNSEVKPAMIVPQLLEKWSEAPERLKREALGKLLAKIQLHDWENGVRAGRRPIEVVEHNWDSV